MQLTTRDIGLALRDHFEDHDVCHFHDDREGERQKVDFIDVSDPNNPVVFIDNGQKFQVRIFMA